MDRSLADATSIAEMLVFKVPALGELGGVASVLLITSASSFLSDLLTCHIQKSQTFEPTVNKSCGKLTIEGNATTTKKCMEIKKFREISLDQFVKV